MSTELVTIDYEDPKMIATLKATVAQGLTDSEFALFSQLCKGTGLNPFKKEVWAIKAGGRLQVMTGVNGFFAIANKNQQFDGYETGLIDPNGDYKTLAYPKNDYIGAWCKVYRKDRKIPSEAIAMLSEYKKESPVWKSMTRVMITKCAESVALRKAFPQEMNGLYTEEEMPNNFSAPKAEPVNITPVKLNNAEPITFIPTYFHLLTVTDEQVEFFEKVGIEQQDATIWVTTKPVVQKVLAKMKDRIVSEDGALKIIEGASEEDWLDGNKDDAHA